MGTCCSDTAGGKQAVGGLGNNGYDEGVETLEAVRALNGARGLSSQIELSLSASNLRDRDTLSKSDPMAVLYSKRMDGSLEELGRTEVILNSLNPLWITKLKLSYNFEEVQTLLIILYDVDTNFSNVPTKKIPLQQQQFLGEIECVLSQIITAPNQTLERALQPRKERSTQMSPMPTLGLLKIRAEEMTHSKEIVEIELKCSDLDNKDLFSTSDPFLVISRKHEDGSFVPVYKTEVQRRSSKHKWNIIKVTLQQLCNGDTYCPLLVQCFNFNANGRHVLVGTTETSLHELQAMVGQKDVMKELQKPSSSSRSTKVAGRLHVEHCSVTRRHTFLDYIIGGCELSFMVAIDFTASNGNPYQRDSLHYIDPSGNANAYQAAIIAVGDVLHYYDTDKQFIAWGFGGKPYQDAPVSHCFHLDLNKSSTEVAGVQGILNAYADAIRRVTLAGPTLFGPVIDAATSIASEKVSQHQQKYFVLLIITDGVITDLQESINALVRAAKMPLSILIVGVGGADFTEMETLDADKGRQQLKSTEQVGEVATRDIVQFVPLRHVRGSASLSQMLLAELPGQFLQYMHIKGIVPNQPRQAFTTVP